jgi:hypothetical protein
VAASSASAAAPPKPGATRRPVAPPGEPPRRLMAAGHVIVVGLVALLLGSLLNAPGIEKTAESQPVGWRRDVSTFFAAPLADVSHFLRTDRPREWLQNALGREGDDDISVSLPSPTTLPEQATTTTVDVSYAPDNPLRIWVGGDSLAVIPGQSVLESFPGASQGVIQSVRPEVDGQVATGLARPEVFNWPDHLRAETASDPDVVILTIGSNDDQALTNAPGGGTITQGDAEAWVAEYRRRIGGLMDQIIGEGRTLVLVGIPIVRDAGRNAEYNTINTIFKEEAAKRDDRVLFVDTYPLFTDADGNYADYLPNDAGDLVRYREGDGIHLTRAGGDLVAEEIFRTIADNFDITSWRSTTTTTSSTTTPTTPTTRVP